MMLFERTNAGNAKRAKQERIKYIAQKRTCMYEVHGGS